jgi:flagellar basal-body rod protein FlgG
MEPMDVVSSVLSHAETRIEVAAQNLANMTTPGYKARKPFFDLIDGAGTGVTPNSLAVAQYGTGLDFTSGKLRSTGNPYDMAISGTGFFVLRSGNEVRYTRNGEFRRDEDGRLVAANGMALQADGGDVVLGANNAGQLSGGALTMLADGTMLEGGQVIAKLRLADFADTQSLVSAGDGMFTAPSGAVRETADPQIHQGMLETSNVSTADEMVSMMAALRSAGMGQHMLQAYDEMLGQALTAFGQS